MLKDKIIVVTGGNGLLGRSFCAAISLHGGIPIVADLNMEGEAFARTLKQGDYFPLNITKKSVHRISEVSEVTINKCFKKLDELKDQLIPPKIKEKYAFRPYIK